MNEPRLERHDAPFPFLGGIFSSLLLAIALDNPERRVLVWFALLPLFISLSRCHERPILRVVHGVAFGLPLCAWNLSWYYAAVVGSQTQPDLADHFRAALVCLASWGTIVFSWVVFALASGPLWRLRSNWLSGLGLAVLWCGLEAARGALRSPWVSTALGVGYAFDPAEVEGQLASLVGTVGLSGLPVLFCAFLTRMLTAGSYRGAIALTAYAILVPLATLLLGSHLEPDTAPREGEVLIGLLRKDEPGAIAGLLGDGGGDLVVWSQLLAAETDAEGEAPFVARHLAEIARTPLLARLETPQGDRAAVLVAPDGSVAARIAPDEARRGVVVPLPSRPEVLLGVAFDGSQREPLVTARLVRRGAGVIVGASELTSPRSPRAQRRRAAELAYRSIETGCAVVSCGETGAFTASPDRRPDLAIDGAVGSSREIVPLSRRWTLYPRLGPLLDVGFTIGGLAVIGAALLVRRRRGRPGRRHSFERVSRG